MLADLLELQRVDSTIDRLTTRRRALPEQAELDDLQEGIAALEREIGDQQAVVDEVALRQRRLDNDIELLSAKIRSEQARLYSGQIANPKELTDIQREVESLKRRVSGLEDADLEVMEERENAEQRLAELNDEFRRRHEAAKEATERRDRASAELDARLEAARAEREVWRPKIDSGLFGLYDDLRSAKGGVGAAAMVDGVCQGCHMRLPAQEMERVRHAEGLVRCDECRRILVVL